MKKVRTMNMRPHALPCLIGALALALAMGGKASADTCLLTNNWTFGGAGAVDGAGTVTVYYGPAYQAVYPVLHPVLSGTIHNVDAGRVAVALQLLDSGGNVIGTAALESPQLDPDTRPYAVEVTSWPAGSTYDFTLDAKAMLEAHFPGIDLSTVSGVLIFLVPGQGADGGGTTAQFSNLCLTDVPTPADLSVTQTASPSPVPSGSQLTYSIQVSNAGEQPAQGVVLTDPLPSGTAFVSASCSANVGTLTTPKGNSKNVAWNVGTLAGGQSVTLTLVVKASAKAGATLSNTATVGSSTPDPNAGNNSSTVSTPVIARR